MHTFELLSSLFMFLSSLVGIICTLIFIGVLIADRQCRTMTTLLALNSVTAGFIVNVVCACQAVYQLTTDQDDYFCVFRGFLLNVTCGLLYHTFCIQAIYRLCVTVPIRRQYLRSKRIILFIVLIQWMISFTYGLPILFDGRIKFQAGSRICQASMTDVYGFLYLGTWTYVLPILIIIGIYIRVIVYIKQHSFPTIISRNILEQQRQKHELRLLRRIIIPVIALFIMGFPYTFFFLIIQSGHLFTPPYAQRICFMFISFGQGISMLLCLMNTDNIRKYLINTIRKVKRRKRQRRVPCVNVIQLPVEIIPVHTL